MSRALPISVLFVLAAALLPGAALGKGASEATIVGPGVDGPITLAGVSSRGQPGGDLQLLARIADESGFFSAVFSPTPDPMLDERPGGALGPKYTITYAMPGRRVERTL